ncbi:MAG: PEP-CTERM sorting domain-containing protein [Planctomycetes bacterium]|nr:PEP-CTERM sorting domain-containing protein [Planctomycetota bacterium]
MTRLVTPRPVMNRLVLAGLAVVALGSGSIADTVYVVSFTTGELIRYDSSDPAGTKTVLSGSGSLVKPGALAMGPDGNLYIGEDGDGATFAPRISKFEPATFTLSTVYAFGGFEVFPGSLAFKGNDLLIGRNPFFGNTGPIVKLSNATGGPVSTSDYTSGGSLASSPGIALAADGSLYVSDQTYDFNTGLASGPVKRFDVGGTYVGEVIASGSSGLAGPTGLALNGSTLYTASIMAGTIVQTILGSDVTTPFASTGSPFEVGALARLADGSLLAGSPSGSGSIYRFGANGALLETFPSGLGQIGGIATVPEPTTFASLAGGIAVGWLLLRRRMA